jgi:hypothetical protein
MVIPTSLLSITHQPSKDGERAMRLMNTPNAGIGQGHKHMAMALSLMVQRIGIKLMRLCTDRLSVLFQTARSLITSAATHFVSILSILSRLHISSMSNVAILESKTQPRLNAIMVTSSRQRTQLSERTMAIDNVEHVQGGPIEKQCDGDEQKDKILMPQEISL